MSARIDHRPLASLLVMLFVVSALLVAPRTLHAQRDDSWVHGGLGLSLLSSQGPDTFTGEKVTARGWGGIAWGPIAPLLHGYATLEGFTNPTGNIPKKFGVFNIVFTVPYHHAPFGLVPFVGGGLGLGGGESGVTPILAGGTLWSTDRGVVPFAMVERLTSRDRTTLRIGVMLGK